MIVYFTMLHLKIYAVFLNTYLISTLYICTCYFNVNLKGTNIRLTLIV